MFKIQRFFPILLMIGALTFTACGGEKEFSAHSSDGGNMPEAFLPANAGVMFSYSLKDEVQYANLKAIEAQLGDDGRVSRAISDGLDTQFSEAGLDYDLDLSPAFGEQFRWVYAGVPGTEDVEAYSIVTLADVAAMESVLEALVEAGDLEEKKLSKVQAYVNEDEQFYATIYDDLLLVSSQPEGLVGMMEQDEDDSLWAADHYQDAVADLGSDHVFYGVMFPENYGQELNLGAGLSIGDLPSVVERQTIVVRAEENGFHFNVDVTGDKSAAKEAGVSFDSVPKAPPYLFEEVPADGLMAYFESYGLAQTFEQAALLEEEGESSLAALETFFQSYFAMDFQEEVLSFFDRGFVFALHQNGAGVVPGLSIYVDVSSDKDNAQSLLSQLDGQVTGLLFVLEAALPGAVTKSTTTIEGETFSLLEIDLSALSRSGDTGHAPLPSVVTASTIQLAYGIKGGRLLITTAEVWEDGGTPVSESELYATLAGELDGVDEGLILLDADGISTFLGTLRSLREQLGLGVTEESLELEGLIDGFLGGIAASDTNSYDTSFSGVLMIEE